MSHLDIQKCIYNKNGINSFNCSCTGSPKRLWIDYVLCLEMAGRIFLVKVCVFFFFLLLLLLLMMMMMMTMMLMLLLWLFFKLLKFSKKIEKYLWIQFVYLSVCPSICARSCSNSLEMT